MDWLAAYPLLKESFGPFLSICLIAAGAFVFYLLQRNPQRMAGADSDGQIAAIDAWKELASTATTGRALAETRADQFARERNDATQAAWELKGQLRVLSEQMQAQTEEMTKLRELVRTQNEDLSALRDQVRALKEQINAKQ